MKELILNDDGTLNKLPEINSKYNNKFVKKTYIKIGAAREAMSIAFEHDRDLFRGYRDNIAMLLCDVQNQRQRMFDFDDKQTRDDMATLILKLLFD